MIIVKQAPKFEAHENLSVEVKVVPGVGTTYQAFAYIPSGSGGTGRFQSSWQGGKVYLLPFQPSPAVAGSSPRLARGSKGGN